MSKTAGHAAEDRREGSVALAGVELSVVIPAWNEEAFLGETIDRIRVSLASLDAPSEVIVVDNNSTDATAAVAEAAGAQLVFEPINQISRARNTGAQAAGGRWFLFIDADTHISRELVASVVETLREEKTVGGGATMVLDQETSAPARTGLALWNAASTRLKIAAGSFFWCRRDAFEDVGGFPESRYAGEELVLSRQLKRWGRKRGMRFRVLSHAPVVTSARKLQWYGSLDLVQQVAVALIPGALRSKRLMKTWYDDSGRQEMRNAKADQRRDQDGG